MPRSARIVVPNTPHHITQRGNRREDVFFSDEDRANYLSWLKKSSQKHGLEILAYCLMTNHIHLVAVPLDESSFQNALRSLHTKYAQYINRKNQWNGHLWQGRFFSSILSESYTWSAIRYVEQNPVRAKMVTKAEDYPWSSAAERCSTTEIKILSNNEYWKNQIDAVGDWSKWIAQSESVENIEALRSSTYRNMPSGSDKFISELEKITGHTIRKKVRGRPKAR